MPFDAYILIFYIYDRLFSELLKNMHPLLLFCKTIETSYNPYFRRLRAYESHLSTVALSNVESSRTVSQILYDMANCQEFQ